MSRNTAARRGRDEYEKEGTRVGVVHRLPPPPLDPRMDNTTALGLTFADHVDSSMWEYIPWGEVVYNGQARATPADAPPQWQRHTLQKAI